MKRARPAPATSVHPAAAPPPPLLPPAPRVVDFTASASLSQATLLVLPFQPPSPFAPALSLLAARPAVGAAAPGGGGALLLLAACSGPLPPSAALAAALGGSAMVAAIEQRGVLRSGGGGRGRALECALVRCVSAGAAAALLARPLSATAAPRRDSGLVVWVARAEAAAAVDTRGLQGAVDAAVSVLDAAGAAASAEKETLRARMQADGFTLVTRRSVLESEEGGAEAAGNRRGKKRTRPGGALNPAAYAAPAAASAQADKARRLQELRRGYEEDAARIARLRAQRKFQPF
jgi:hypothetical protein